MNEIVSRYLDLQRQYEAELEKKYPNWSRLQRLIADIHDLLRTYPELREIKEEPNK